MKLPKTYEPQKYEADIYKLWEKSRVFTADPHSSKPHFSMSMPPPNETGTLHVGHALFLTLQDILARDARRKGKDVLWLPGTDHAALATNALVERQLAEKGTSKHELGREAFIDEVKEFVGNSRQTITSQIRAIGASCDWSRLRHTLDEALNRCVNEVFVKMYNDGLIYRGYRIVNWDPKLETTVSDDEVVYKEEKSPFYTLQYGPFQIGTARPETKFGDKYLVIHPEDKRYAQYKHGDTFEVEWINGKVTAQVIKDEAVDPSFGTGVMTITPWHDHTDFEIAERHGLEKEQIIDFSGRLLPIAGEFAGMTIEEVRPKIVEKLRAKGLLVKVDENYSHNIALNDRGKGIIEPQIKLQWFVDVNRPAVTWKGQLRSLKEVMRAVVEDGDIRIIPKRFEKVYYHWIDNLRDWCISRQIWWGHQVPVWYKYVEESGKRVEGKDEHLLKNTYVGTRPPEGGGWEQDEDTLDTWFSSALWTWSTLVDPQLAKNYSLSLEELLDKSLDYRIYHPTDVMETGWDILFFWVARMILATTYATGEIPFRSVYLHGLVRTEAGKKMSKSDPDSIINPIAVIPEYGTDALRLALVAGATAGNDQRLSKTKIIANRNFCNKLWNIARYIEGVAQPSSIPQPKTAADHWIARKLSEAIDGISDDLENFRFGDAYEHLYHFVWDNFADWYVEASKLEANPPFLALVLEATLVLAHPFAPFVTEAIWQNLAWENDSLLASRNMPSIPKEDPAQVVRFDELKSIISEIRWLGAMSDTKPESLYYKDVELTPKEAELISKLAGLKEVKQAPEDYSQGLRLTSVRQELRLDVDPAAVRSKLEAKLKENEQAVKALAARLQNRDYTDKAPQELVTETKQQLEETQAQLKHLQKVLQSLKG